MTIFTPIWLAAWQSIFPNCPPPSTPTTVSDTPCTGGPPCPSGVAGSMEAWARSESGGGDAAVPLACRGLHDARRGWPPAEGREEDEEAAEAEAEDGALRSLACMLPPGGRRWLRFKQGLGGGGGGGDAREEGRRRRRRRGKR
uniref:Uncharacterized protein n=1 Tax=Arundo donax TaxID=35708 RepID=A0A0A9F2A1_ARUDO